MDDLHADPGEVVRLRRQTRRVLLGRLGAVVFGRAVRVEARDDEAALVGHDRREDGREPAATGPELDDRHVVAKPEELERLERVPPLVARGFVGRSIARGDRGSQLRVGACVGRGRRRRGPRDRRGVRRRRGPRARAHHQGDDREEAGAKEEGSHGALRSFIARDEPAPVPPALSLRSHRPGLPAPLTALSLRLSLRLKDGLHRGGRPIDEARGEVDRLAVPINAGLQGDELGGPEGLLQPLRRPPRSARGTRRAAPRARDSGGAPRRATAPRTAWPPRRAPRRARKWTRGWPAQWGAGSPSSRGGLRWTWSLWALGRWDRISTVVVVVLLSPARTRPSTSPPAARLPRRMIRPGTPWKASAPEARERVVVAMSGGVDSSLAAARLVDGGHEVVGVTLHLWDYPEEGTGGREGARPLLRPGGSVRRAPRRRRHGLSSLHVRPPRTLCSHGRRPFRQRLPRGRHPQPVLRVQPLGETRRALRHRRSPRRGARGHRALCARRARRRRRSPPGDGHRPHERPELLSLRESARVAREARLSARRLDEARGSRGGDRARAPRCTQGREPGALLRREAAPTPTPTSSPSGRMAA